MRLGAFLPDDWQRATLVGRLATDAGPTPVVLRDGRIEDVSRIAPTVAELLNRFSPADALPRGVDLGPIESLDCAAVWESEPGDSAGDVVPAKAGARLLAPVDLQCVKAAGVTFAISALERVIEERARGDASQARVIRDGLAQRIGSELSAVRPGSPDAAKLKQVLISDGLWSQYLEVAIGPDAEIFTKAPVLSAVGWGAHVGIRDDSAWNNPEPEIVLVCDGKGRIRGAALGNDVNLRDIEGRSALLLGKAKDNNASCAIGPFIRLFDDVFTLATARASVVSLEIRGADRFELDGASSMSMISRDPAELVSQAIGRHHQYPDGFALFLGTMFAPVKDRDAPGRGFTHKPNDRVRIATPSLGTLENLVVTCDAAPPWTFGITDLMRNLAARGLLHR
jgi:fumarylacetoacetate (FAA) hydrolase family protein